MAGEVIAVDIRSPGAHAAAGTVVEVVAGAEDVVIILNLSGKERRSRYVVEEILHR